MRPILAGSTPGCSRSQATAQARSRARSAVVAVLKSPPEAPAPRVEAQGGEAPAGQFVGPDGEGLVPGRGLVAPGAPIPVGKDHRAASLTRRPGQGSGPCRAIGAGERDVLHPIGERRLRGLGAHGAGFPLRRSPPEGDGETRRAVPAGPGQGGALRRQIEGNVHLGGREGDGVGRARQRRGPFPELPGAQGRKTGVEVEAEGEPHLHEAGVEDAVPDAGNMLIHGGHLAHGQAWCKPR
jgi:hypothetical protein